MACKLKILAVIITALLMVSCRLFIPKSPDGYGRIWTIDNRSKQEIVIHSTLLDDGSFSIRHGQEWNYFSDHRDDMPSFDELLTAHLKIEEDPMFSIEVNGVMVKTWRYSERNDPGRQYFNEQFWTKEFNGESVPETRWTVNPPPIYQWTFEILPEDIE
jgi:hypothetical protein